MSDRIFEPIETNKELSDSKLSFKDCPNKCIDGYYVDPYKHKKVKCLYCEKLRKQLISEKITSKDVDIRDELKLPRAFSDYSEDVVIPLFARKDLEEDSVNNVLKVMTDLIEQMTAGIIPDYSMLFNLGALCHEECFISTFLSRAYINGFSVSPFYAGHDIMKLRTFSESQYSVGVEDKYEQMLDSDVCVLCIELGASRQTIQAVEGVVVLRSYRNKATILITKVSPKVGQFEYFTCPETEKCKSLCVYYGIEYTEKYEEQEKKREEAFGSARQFKTTKSMSLSDYNNLKKPVNNL